jgi:hypothetical protein
MKQIIQGTKKTEFYSASLRLDVNRRSMESMSIAGATPVRRIQHSYLNTKKKHAFQFESFPDILTTTKIMGLEPTAVSLR